MCATAPQLGDEVAWNRTREQGECPPQLPAPPPTTPVGEMGKVKGREGKGAERGWFGLSFGALPTRRARASNVNGGRKEGRDERGGLKGGRIIGHEIVCAALSLSLSTLPPLPLGTLAQAV